MQDRIEATAPAPAAPPYAPKPGKQPQRVREQLRREQEPYWNQFPDETVLATDEAAEVIGFPEGTLRNSRMKSGPQSGRLGGIKAPEHITDGRRVYYKLGALRAWRKAYDARFEARITKADA